jgi:integrase
MSKVFTDATIRSLRLPGRYTDPQTRGLNLHIKKNGGRYWNYRYTKDGKRVDLSLGSYPAVSLKEARSRAIKARADVLTRGAADKSWQPEKVPQETLKTVLFRDYASECIKQKSAEWRNAKHAAQWRSTIEQYANPVLGDLPLDEIDTDHVLQVVSPIWAIKTETASRLRGRIEWILAAAITRKLRPSPNPAAWRGHLETLLPRPKKVKAVRHHPALPYDQIPALIARLHDTDSPVALALEFLILCASRTSEVTGALRTEISDSGVWIIPASRMKALREHRTPLSRRSMEIVQTASYLGGESSYIFSVKGKPLSNMAMSMMLRRLGYTGLTVHGFRSGFRDWVSEETNHSPEVAEMALAHTIGNKVEAAYRRGDLLARRRELMRDWENFCLASGSLTLLQLDQRKTA